MTTAELVKQVLQGILVLVGEYRGSDAEMVGYVDKKSREAIRHVRAIHLVECIWYDRVDRVLLIQYFAPAVATIEQATACARIGNSGRLGPNSCHANAKRALRIFGEISIEGETRMSVPLAPLGGIRERLGMDEGKGRRSRNAF